MKFEHTQASTPLIQAQVVPAFEDYDFDKALMRNVAQLQRRASYKEKLNILPFAHIRSQL